MEESKKTGGYSPPGMTVGGTLVPQIHQLDRRSRQGGGGGGPRVAKTSIRRKVVSVGRPLKAAAARAGFRKVAGQWRAA